MSGTLTPLETSLNFLGEELRELFQEKLDESDFDVKPWSLPRPRVCVMEAARSRDTLGWYAHNRWKRGAAKLHEIVLTPKAVSHGVYRAIEVLAHEFVHLANAVANRSDTCRDGRYHNSRFRKTAILLGLVVKEASPHGWCHTELGEELRCWAQRVIRDKRVSPYVFSYDRLRAPEKPKALTRIECNCGTFAYVTSGRTKSFRIFCGDCGARLTQSDVSDDS